MFIHDWPPEPTIWLAVPIPEERNCARNSEVSGHRSWIGDIQMFTSIFVKDNLSGKLLWAQHPWTFHWVACFCVSLATLLRESFVRRGVFSLAFWDPWAIFSNVLLSRALQTLPPQPPLGRTTESFADQCFLGVRIASLLLASNLNTASPRNRLACFKPLRALTRGTSSGEPNMCQCLSQFVSIYFNPPSPKEQEAPSLCKNCKNFYSGHGNRNTEYLHQETGEQSWRAAEVWLPRRHTLKFLSDGNRSRRTTALCTSRVLQTSIMEGVVRACELLERHMQLYGEHSKKTVYRDGGSKLQTSFPHGRYLSGMLPICFLNYRGCCVRSRHLVLPCSPSFPSYPASSPPLCLCALSCWS